jgi:hypothetical protein
MQMKTLLKVSSFLRFSGRTRVHRRREHIDPYGDLRYLNDRGLADIGLRRRVGRELERTLFLP